MDVFSWRDELFASIAHHIEAVGWSVVHVGGGGCVVPGCCGEHESDLAELGLPAYGYTVGLPVRFDHPELVLVGMEAERTSQILNAIAGLVATGVRLKPGDLLEIDGMSMKVSPCATARVRDGLVAVSMDYHYAIEHPSLPNPMQIMWPDAKGRFPGDTGFDRQVRRAQPMLARPASRDRPRR